MNGVAIRYGDVAPEAKENFAPSATDRVNIGKLSNLQRYNLSVPNYASPCEMYQTLLDGTAAALPSDLTSANVGLWSNSLSGADGKFATPIVLTLDSGDNYYSSQGLTFTFDKYNNIYCNSLNITWYQDETELESVDYEPDNAFYFCRQFVERYNRLVITFNSINMPDNRLKLNVIDYGYGTYFYGNELRNVKLIQEIDPISTEIAINTCDFTLDSKTDMEYSFQAKQPLNVFFNGQLKATTFVKTSKRKSKQLWTVESEDYIGLLDGMPFHGDIYTGKNVVELFDEMFGLNEEQGTIKIPYEIDPSLKTATVTGYIPYTTCREALMHIAIAIGAVVDTSNSEYVKIYALSDTVTQTIELSRIRQGQSFDDEETTTGVEVTAHTYTEGTESVTVYKASEDGTGSDILVKFSEPLHSLTISNGTITESSANHAIITADAGCVLTGKKYEHETITLRKDRAGVLTSEVEKVVAIENATLISRNNVNAVLARSFEWLTKNSQVNLKIIEGKQISGGEVIRYGQAKYGTVKYGQKTEKVITYDQAVNVGEVITTQTGYLGDITGRVIKETFNLNGGIIIKEAVLK